MTRAREVANIFSSGLLASASYDLEGVIDQALAILPSGSNADGGTVSSSSGVTSGGVYSIIEDNNTYTYDGGTV